MTAPARVYENGDLLRRVRELQALMADIERAPRIYRVQRLTGEAQTILAEMAHVLKTAALAQLGGTS